jgi:N-methylhydantoinase A
MAAEGLKSVSLRSLDMRYVGQGYELNIQAGGNPAARFHNMHKQRYGYADCDRPVEVVNLRVRMIAATPAIQFSRHTLHRGNGKAAILKKRTVYFGGRPYPTPVYDRSKLASGDVFSGPAVVVEYSATSVIPPGCRVHTDAWQNLIIEVNRA